LIEGFLQGLREHGYVEGRNIIIEYRFSEDRNDRLPALAAELVEESLASC
jgi:putative tryptophan/tyrosine transport system substrate-binding protein